MGSVKESELKYFYKTLFSDSVACILLGAFGTHLGRFDYWQREYAIGWGNDQWNRRHVVHHWRDALRLLRKDCCNINLGGIFSIPLSGGASVPALTPYDLAAAPPSAAGGGVPGPRDWERKHVWRDDAGTPLGELVIDVDLDDQLEGMYDRRGICGCAGQKRTVCEVCWHVFMDPAQAAMEVLLRHFGVTKYIVYFSGRRGLHWWLLDDWIIMMTNGERARLMESFNTPPNEHSALGRAMYEALAPYATAHPALQARCPPGDYVSLMRELYPKMDVPVGADASHLHGIPLTLHPETRVLRIPVGSINDPRTCFSYKHDRFDVDRLTKNPNNIVWACALRLLAILLGPNASITPTEWVQKALSEGGHAFSKSEAFK